MDIRFGTRVDDLLVENGNVVGVEVSDSRSNLKFNSQKLGCDAAVLAVGHSARDIYQMLLSHDTILVPKEFAVRFSANVCVICFHCDMHLLFFSHMTSAFISESTWKNRTTHHVAGPLYVSNSVCGHVIVIVHRCVHGCHINTCMWFMP